LATACKRRPDRVRLLDQIYDAAGRKLLFGLYDFHDVLSDLVVEHGRPIENVYGACDVIQSSNEKPHRAGPDAVLMGRVLKLALDPNFTWTDDVALDPA
jgi:hypothetical protein